MPCKPAVTAQVCVQEMVSYWGQELVTFNFFITFFSTWRVTYRSKVKGRDTGGSEGQGAHWGGQDRSVGVGASPFITHRSAQGLGGLKPLICWSLSGL